MYFISITNSLGQPQNICDLDLNLQTGLFKTALVQLQSCIFTQDILFFFFFNFWVYLFIYLWLCWVFVSVRGLSLVAASGGHSSSRCTGLSLLRPLLLRSTGSRRAGSVIVAHGPSCSVACGIFPDQGSNPCPLHWQADSQPLRHQGSPPRIFLTQVWSFHASFKYLLNSSLSLLRAKPLIA